MVTINPADALPGEVYEGTVDGERLVLFRRSDEYSYQWESLSDLHDHVDVSDLVRLAPAAGGEWTRDDLPSAQSLREYEVPATLPDGSVVRGWNVLVPPDRALDEIVDHLNTHHPKPGRDAEFWIDRWKSAAEENEFALDEMRRERDEARRSEDEWERERDEAFVDRDEAMDAETAALGRAKQAENARDTAATRAAQLEKEVGKWRTATESAHSDFLQAAHDRDEWKALAKWKARTAPAVTQADIEKALDTGIRGATDGDLIGQDTSIPSGECVRLAVDAVCDLLGIEAEQATDPVEEKARELARAGGIDFDQLIPAGIEILIGMARHVLGQEADR